MHDYISSLFTDIQGVIEVREITNNGNVTKRWFKDLTELMEYQPSQIRNVYIGMATRKNRRNGEKSNCLHTRVLWADFDKMSKTEVLEVLSDSVLPDPSILINSGHGVHAYWMLDEPAGPEIEPVLQAIVKELDSDPMVAHFGAVMRLPDTKNVKDKPVPCTVISYTGEIYNLNHIAELMNVTAEVDKSCTVVIPVLQKCPMSCVREMSKGVSKGQRNFALGKITAYLKQQGFNFKKSYEVVKKWNRNNTPKKSGNELYCEFSQFWDGDWQYLGCSFTNDRLEGLQRSFCNKANCKYHTHKNFQIVDGEAYKLDNHIFKRTIYPDVKPLTLAVLSMLSLAEPAELMTRTEVARLLKCNYKSPAFADAIKTLDQHGYIKIHKAGNPSEPDKLELIEKGNYGRGYTVINSLLTRLYIANGLTSGQYKLLILLESYSFASRDIWPSNETLAINMGLSERRVRQLLVELENDRWLKRYETINDNGQVIRVLKLKYERYRSKN